MAIAALKPPYDNIDQAFMHLKPLDKYEAWEVRDPGNYVVAFFPQTMSVRLFQTLENVGRFYAWSIYRHDIYVTPEQIASKFTTAQLELFNARAGLSQTDNMTALDYANNLWHWMQEVGDLATKFGTSLKGMDEDKYLVRVDLLKSEEIIALVNQLPKQAKIIATALANAEKTSYTEAEWTTFAIDLKTCGALKTKQDPVRVADYYRGTLADLGVFTYSTRREREEDGETEDQAIAA